MALEPAHKINVPKPWGLTAKSDWAASEQREQPIGEIWYDRTSAASVAPALLLKILMTSKPLSIQVHPDDKYAILMGLANGKTEAWHVLAAEPGAQVALGPLQSTSADELRAAIAHNRLSELLHWRPAHAGETIFVPAGTIHAIGAGLVIAEIQQRSDATFRLSDHDRGRTLHIDDAIAVAHTEPLGLQSAERRMNNERSLLLANSHFVFERIELPAASAWCLEAQRETWLLVIDGGATINSTQFAKGDCVFAQAETASLHVGSSGLTALVAYVGPNFAPRLLRPTRARPLNRPPAPNPTPRVAPLRLGQVMKVPQ
jgi:mannose-6-phosphate isomerase